ncbi:putative adipose-regulatory protein (Seipin) [Lyophyllum shimeji]|uniref:Adipose-regulatory protein (Seipin) n=1 Tax=Lyophyllum shimeji TaxID=47721 RepID=A0A9P3UM63_LYOSH|nr:putative adipose-regulatory protein (Seipin) [Lyophyllum shimeji]
MDNTHTSSAQEHHLTAHDRESLSQVLLNVLSSLLRFLLAVASNALSFLRPYAPQIIPVLTCVFIIPLFVLLSSFAGFLVWKNVAVGWETPLHLQFGDGAPPYALTPLPPLISQQRYDVSVHLTIPAIESNFALGNFMTTLTLSTASNKTLTTVRRPAIASPPRASFLRRTPITISLTVPMLASFVPGTSMLLAFVEVGRRDGWRSLGKGEGREISVIAASVRGSVVHHGIRGLVARFPLTFALISAATFFVILSVIMTACILPTVFRHKPESVLESPLVEEMIKGRSVSPLGSSSSDSEERPPPRRRRSRLSGSTSAPIRVKVEAPTTTMPPADVKPDQLRRRTSKAFDGLSDSEF